MTRDSARDVLTGRFKRNAARFLKLISLGAPDVILEAERHMLLEIIDSFPTDAKSRADQDRVISLNIRRSNDEAATARKLFSEKNPGKDLLDQEVEVIEAYLSEAQRLWMMDDPVFSAMIDDFDKPNSGNHGTSH